MSAENHRRAACNSLKAVIFREIDVVCSIGVLDSTRGCNKLDTEIKELTACSEDLSPVFRCNHFAGSEFLRHARTAAL